MNKPLARARIFRRFSEDLKALVSGWSKPCLLGDASSKDYAETCSSIRESLRFKKICLAGYARTGIYVALRSLGLGAGSTIAMSPLTIHPIREVIHSLGIDIVFIDIDLTTFSINACELEECLNKNKIDAVLMTHLFGMLPDLRKIQVVRERFRVPVIEDFSQAIGSHRGVGFRAGEFGDISVYSCSLGKMIDSHGGCIITTKDSDLHKRLEKEVSQLRSVDRKFMSKRLFGSIIWGLALNPVIFAFATYPLLLTLHAVNKERYKSLVGPKISSYGLERVLPRHYYNFISGIQCKQLKLRLAGLHERLENQKITCKRILRAYWIVAFKTSPNRFEEEVIEEFLDQNRLWQFCVEVESTARAQEHLFIELRVETGSTNLPDLSSADERVCRNAKTIKEKTLFIPISAGVDLNGYEKIFRCLDEASLLKETSWIEQLRVCRHDD